MSVSGAEKGGHLDAPTSAAASDLEAVIKDVEKAARHWGVRPDHLEGRFVAALLTAMRWVSQGTLAGIADLRKTLDNAKALVDADLALVRATNDQAGFALKKAEAARALAEEERTRTDDQAKAAIRGVCEELGPQLIDRLKPWMVLRETDFNHKEKWRRFKKAAVMTLVMLGIGYGFRAWQDEAATLALGRCVSAARAAPAGGQLVCDVADLLPRVPR
jgi:hypothetical protein